MCSVTLAPKVNSLTAPLKLKFGWAFLIFRYSWGIDATIFEPIVNQCWQRNGLFIKAFLKFHEI